MDTNEGTTRELLANTVITDVNTATQYMIHRIPETSTQLLSPELLPHNGLVDLGSGDFIPVPVGYSSDDLLTHELTDEDRNLAAALVAVQLSQQQKQQQVNYGLFTPQDVHTNLGNKAIQDQVIITNKEDSATAMTNPSSSFIRIVGTENIYIEKQLMKSEVTSSTTESDTQLRYASATDEQEEYTTAADSKTEIRLLPIKSEEDRRDSDGDSLRNENRSNKKSLPHKKRISRKLKKNNSHLQKKIVCNLCEQTFNSNDEFAQHEILCQTTITPLHPASFSCQLCTDSFQDQLRFFEHLKKHYEPSNSSLLPSSSSTQTQPSTTHTTKAKEEKESEKQESILSSLLNLTCIECNKTFRRQKTFEAHVRDVHSTKNTQLDEFSDTEDLMEGINVVVGNDAHSDMDDDSKHWYHEDDLQQTEEDLKELEADNGHICHLCKQPFQLRALLLQHLVTCRSNASTSSEPTPVVLKKKAGRKKGTLQCPQCDRIFSHRNSLNYHIRGHSGIRPHHCDQCGKSFFASSALKVHMRLHSGDKPYTCNECGKRFRQWGDLKYHISSLHSTEKQYQCEYCGKEFARKYSLIVHRRIHTGEKNYKCEYCGKTFRASSYLQNHRRIHTGEKPHPCSICGKPFRVRSDMKRHQKTHRGFMATKSADSQGQKVNGKLEKIEQEEEEEENTAELHIGEEEEAAEHILADYYPINEPGNSIRVQGNKNINLNELFLVTYPRTYPPAKIQVTTDATSTTTTTTTTESSNATWISSDS